MFNLLLRSNPPSTPALVSRVRQSAFKAFLPAILLASVAVSSSLAQSDFSVRGPNTTLTSTAPGYTIFQPTTLAANGIKNPVIVWGNGTGASPSSYSGLLNHLASYGFVVVAANTTNAGSGVEISGGIDLILSENQRVGSRFFGTIATTEIGVSGHSQGAIGAVNVAINDARVSAAFPLAGLKLNRGALRIPVFAMAGSNDFVISARSVRGIFTGATGPAVYGVLQGASHLAPVGPSPNAEIRHYITAWFRLFLFNEASLNSQFFVAGRGINSDPQWQAEFKNPPLL